MCNKKIFFVLAIIFFFPNWVFSAPQPKNITLTGIVVRSQTNQVYFVTNSAGRYSAEISQAKLSRRNGSAMLLSEILPGDKLEVKGNIWPDNSINAESVRNLSLYPRKTTISGKILSIDVLEKSLFVQSPGKQPQKVKTNQFTIFKVNSVAFGFDTLESGLNLKAEGVWERQGDTVEASLIQVSSRLVNIDFNGEVVMVSPLAITVLAENNVIYGVNIEAAKLQNKKNKVIPIGQFSPGQKVRVWGRHISGKEKVFASRVKNSSLE